MRLAAATRRPRTRPFREEMALDMLLSGDPRMVRLISLRHLACAVAAVRKIAAHRGLALAFGATQGEA